MEINIQPIGNNILLEPVSSPTTILRPSSTEPDSYKVVAIGDGDKIPKTIHVGDTVVLASTFTLVEIKDSKLKLTASENVLALVRPKQYDE